MAGMEAPLHQLHLRDGLTREEQRSVTHGDFWIPEEEREKYKRALSTLNAAAIPYVVSGAYAIYEHTGIYRETKDLDLFVRPADVERAIDERHPVTCRLEPPMERTRSTSSGSASSSPSTVATSTGMSG